MSIKSSSIPKVKRGKFFLDKIKKKKIPAVPRKDGYIWVHKYYKILQAKKLKAMTKSKEKWQPRKKIFVKHLTGKK